MTIKRTVAVSSVLLLIAAVILIFLLKAATNSVATTRAVHRDRSYALALAGELKESSQDLTSAVQKFVVTGDDNHANDYNDILLIRSGKKPRPEGRAIAPGQLVTLNELISHAGYSEEELRLLQYAYELSDTLALYEIEAMNIMKGLYIDKEGNYTIVGKPDGDLARRMIFSDNYEITTNEIMRTFDIFERHLDSRLNNSIEMSLGRYDRAMSVVWAVLSAVVIMFTAFLLMVYFMIVRPVLMCKMFAEQVMNGNLDSRLSYSSGNEIGSLASSLRSMLEYLLERMHLKEHARYFDAVISVADAGVVVMDENHLITDWNLGAEHILGYKAEEVSGKTRKIYAPDGGHSGIDDMEARLKNGENIMRMDIERRHKNGNNIIISASYTPVFDDDGHYKGSVSIFHEITEVKRLETAVREALSEVEERNKTIISSIDYASRIQKHLLTRESVFKKVFSDYSILWKPRDIVGGDIYCLKNFGDSAVLCVCDCTGHGIPGALLTMMVVSTFEAIINDGGGKDTANIIWQMDRKLAKVLNYDSEDSDIKDGCDLAVLYIGKDGGVTISSGNMPVFICDGKRVNRIKGQRLYIGEGRLKGKNEVNIVVIPPCADNKFYIASDGLFDQIGGNINIPFGYKEFERVILENHNEKQDEISNRIWELFETHKGTLGRFDDVELIAFKP